MASQPTRSCRDDRPQPYDSAGARQSSRCTVLRPNLRLKVKDEAGHFAPVRVNDTLTLLFDEDDSFESHHYAFHVSDAEFDDIFTRIKKAGLSYGSAPWSLDDGKLNDWNGGRGLYFKDLNGHVLELMTAPQ